MVNKVVIAQQLEALLLKSSIRTPAKYSTKGEHIQHLIHSFYLPVFEWAHSQLRSSCVVLGLSCVQGGGKTTISNYIEKMFAMTGKKCATLSLDDVYLTRSDQLAVANSHPGNPLLEHRGNPGTHDLDLLMRLIEDGKAGRDILVPRYNKSAFDGRGDRFPQEEWIAHQGPLDVLLIEGWCLGFEAKDTMIDEHLKPVNHALRDFELLYAQLTAMIVVEVSDVNWVYNWREEAEAQMRDAGKPAMTPSQVCDFVDRFMPAYRMYLPTLYSTSTSTNAKSQLCQLPQLTIEIDHMRECTFFRTSQGAAC